MTFKGFNYISIKKTYAQPYTIVSEIIKDAEQDKRKSKYIISDEEWKASSVGSEFKLIREPINWTELKDFIQKCDGSHSSLSYNDGNASFKVMKQNYKNKYQTANVTCFEYSKMDGDHIGNKYITLFS